MINTIETYKKMIEQHTSEQIIYQPSKAEWSISQIVDHCILVAEEYLEAASGCLKESEERLEGKSEFGEKLFSTGGFPPIKIKLPDEMNAPPVNSEDKLELLNRLDELHNKMKAVSSEIRKSPPNFKLKHGGFGWLNALEWYDLIDMHFRHHLRQIDERHQEIREASI